MIGRLRAVPSLILAGLLAGLLLWAGFNIWVMRGGNHRAFLATTVVPVADWQVVEGEGGVREEGLILTTPGRRGFVLAAAPLSMPFEAGSFGAISVGFSQLGAHHQLLVGVAGTSSLSDMREAPLRIDADGEGRLNAADLFLADQKIRYVTVRIRGALEPKTVLERVTLHRARPSFSELQRMLFSSLIDLSEWTQRSINQNRPGDVPLRVSPVVSVALWIGLFIALGVLFLGRSRLGSWPWPMLVGIGLLVGWVLLDAGWQVSLWARHLDTVWKYSGTPSERKAISEADAEIAAFMRDLKGVLADAQKPIVIMSDSEFMHLRAKYAAMPNPAVSLTGVAARWLRRLEAQDVLVTLDLANPLNEKSVSFSAPKSDGESREWPLQAVAGSQAEVVGCSTLGQECDGAVPRLRKEQQPWLVEVPWLDELGAGVWRVNLDLAGGYQPGWVRLEVFRGGSGDGQRWAWREVYLNEDQLRHLSIAFRVEEGADYKVRLRQLNARGVSVRAIRLLPLSPDGDLVELSLDGDPPYYLARRLLESGGKRAWEML